MAAPGLLFTALLAVLIVTGSQNLRYFDAPAVGYTFVLRAERGVLRYVYRMERR